MICQSLPVTNVELWVRSSFLWRRSSLVWEPRFPGRPPPLSGNQGSRDGPLLFTSPFGGHCVVLALLRRASTKTILEFQFFIFLFNKKENNFCIVLSKGGKQNILKPTFDFLYAILYQIYIYIIFMPTSKTLVPRHIKHHAS